MKPIFAVPATLALVYRAWSHKSLKPAGIVVAALTAAVHALHPWNLPFVLLVVFFLAGTRVTKVCIEFPDPISRHEADKHTGQEGGKGEINNTVNRQLRGRRTTDTYTRYVAVHCLVA
jgi:uncharacterized membrane protein